MPNHFERLDGSGKPEKPDIDRQRILDELRCWSKPDPDNKPHHDNKPNADNSRSGSGRHENEVERNCNSKVDKTLIFDDPFKSEKEPARTGRSANVR